MTSHGSPVLDLTQTDTATANFLIDYFAAKTRQDPVAALDFFATDALTYTDAPLGWAMNGRHDIAAAFAGAMPQWGAGRSYPTAILGAFGGADGSALVAFTNTPGIVGDALLHILAAVDVRAGKIVRWVDYWDSSGIEQGFREQVRTPAAAFPLTFAEEQLSPVSGGAVETVATALHRALTSGDAGKAATLFDDDACWEDLSLHVKITGRPAIERYLDQSVELSPIGPGSRLRHVVGRDRAGGFEWFAAPSTNVRSGITALGLTAEGRIATAKSVYDGLLLGDDARRTLITLATRP